MISLLNGVPYITNAFAASWEGVEMKLKRVEHVAIAVNDMAESMKMLENTLGIEMEYEEQIGSTRLAMYPVGETYLELLSSNASAHDSRVTEWIEQNGQSLFHLCFEVEDIDAALDELKEKKVKIDEVLDKYEKMGNIKIVKGNTS